ncbi:hypothetical protein SAMCCGM7_Ch3067 [Sinorhizobium americanum CCGM7]|nr:hypothetical protein SAMCCGM7_Ch3067 [Sinorhizobium americanum CCGM7]
MVLLSWHVTPRSPVTEGRLVFRAALVIPRTFMYRHGIELKKPWPRAVRGFIYVFGPKVAMPCDNWTLEL